MDYGGGGGSGGWFDVLFLVRDSMNGTRDRAEVLPLGIGRRNFLRRGAA